MTIRTALPTFRGPSYYVQNLVYSSDIDLDGMTRADMGVPIAANPTGILNAQSIAVAGNNTALNANYYTATAIAGVIARYGRNLTVVASGPAVSAVTIDGFDYLGQGIRETVVLNGATPVSTLKAFASVSGVTWGATAATTINVGWGNSLGLPYRAANPDVSNELTANVKPATPGVLVVGAQPIIVQSASTADPRGLYTPNLAPDGVRTYVFNYNVDVISGAHGNRHFSG
jgi:hypothetical protein